VLDKAKSEYEKVKKIVDELRASEVLCQLKPLFCTFFYLFVKWSSLVK
jgi:hypothetical protein